MVKTKAYFIAMQLNTNQVVDQVVKVVEDETISKSFIAVGAC